MAARMDVGAICNREVVSATAGTSLKEAVQLTRDKHVGSLAAVREAEPGHIVTGTLTCRDIAVVAMVRG